MSIDVPWTLWSWPRKSAESFPKTLAGDVPFAGAGLSGHADLRDQLRRAAFSVPLNIAEGAGRASEADGARYFAIARGSAMECAAALDVVRALGVLQDDVCRRALELLAREVAMLTKLCRQQQS